MELILETFTSLNFAKKVMVMSLPALTPGIWFLNAIGIGIGIGYSLFDSLLFVLHAIFYNDLELSHCVMLNVATVRMESSAMDMQAHQGKDLLWRIFMRPELMVLREK